MKSEFYYENNEKRRRKHLNEIHNWSESEHIEKEKIMKKNLLELIVSKKYKKNIIETFHNFINPKYLDQLRELCELTKEDLHNINNLEDLKNILNELIKIIPERVVNEYNLDKKIKEKSNQKYLFFLKRYEWMK